jgi:N4-gp56 family major capsid protein
MSEQRIPFSVREEARMGLQDWWSDRIDTAFFNHICGNSGASTVYNGSNTVTAPSTNRILYMNGLTTETQIASASASNKFTIQLIDYALERAKVASPLIRPVKVNRENKYVMFLHPYQVTDLRTNTATGQWLDITKAAYQGSKQDNPIYSGALGEYNGVILHESTRVQSVTANVYRSVLCGAQAVSMAFGMSGGENQVQWTEELFDYQNQLGVSAGMIWGLKKMVFNSEDFGTIVVPTYGAQH